MKHYIDKDALVAEIERRVKSLHQVNSPREQAVLYECEDILSFLDTLEVKEVNLENEIDKVWDTDYEDFGISADDFYRITRYFFELGLKAQKGE